MITQPLSDFVRADDRYRNAGFKLIPHIAKGSWIVKQSVGKTACLIGEALEITYHTDKHYIEVIQKNLGKLDVLFKFKYHGFKINFSSSY
jgi:hypothetical protein